MKACAVCGTAFTPATTWQMTCSPRCGQALQNQKQRKNPEQKRCRTCLSDLPVSAFNVGHPTCRPCEDLHASGHKRCTRCQEAKPFTEFHRRPDRRLGYDASCKACKAEYARTRNSTPDRQAANRAVKLRSRYGATPEQYEAMFKAQQGRCAICQETSPATLHVDHCHASGRVRQLLCRQCNVLLGTSRDDPAILRRALEYLERHAHVPDLGP